MDNLKEIIVTENNSHEILECSTANEVEEAYKLSVDVKEKIRNAFPKAQINF